LALAVLAFVLFGAYDSYPKGATAGTSDRKHNLTHYRPVMPFGNRKKYFRGYFKFSIVKI